jgi:hypothetical protein
MEFYLDQNNLFNLDKAFINEVYYEDKVAQPTTNANTTNTNTSATTTTPNTNTTPETNAEEKTEKVKKERRTNCIIKLVSCNYGNSPNSLTAMTQRETSQENEDKNIKYIKDKRNELETFMYTTRENLTSSLQGFFDEKEAESLNSIMVKTEEWMYNNVEETYIKEKIEEWYNLVTVPGNKIYRRKTHWENLDKAMNEAQTVLNTNIQKFEQNTSTLIQTEADELKKVVQQFNDFYNSTLPILVKSPKFVDAPVDYVSVERQTREFEDRVRKVYSDADKRIKQAQKLLEEERKKQSEEQAKAAAPNTSTNGNTSSGDSNMNVD